MEQEIKETKENKSIAWGVSGFIVSLVAIMPFMFMPYFGIFMSIFSIIAFYLQKKINNTGLAVAGLVIGILGLLINAVILVFILFIVAAATTL